MELTENVFYKFKVNFFFQRGLQMRVNPSHTIVTHLPEEKKIYRPAYEVELPAHLAQKHGTPTVLVAHFSIEDWSNWAGSSINDEEVFNFLMEMANG